MSPSGKAPGSGPGIRGFESLHPSQNKITTQSGRNFILICDCGIRAPGFVYQNVAGFGGMSATEMCLHISVSEWKRL